MITRHTILNFLDKLSPGFTLNKDTIKIYLDNGKTKTEVTTFFNLDDLGL